MAKKKGPKHIWVCLEDGATYWPTQSSVDCDYWRKRNPTAFGCDGCPGPRKYTRVDK